MMSSTACGSAAHPLAPRRRASSSRASATVSRSRARAWAPWAATRPGKLVPAGHHHQAAGGAGQQRTHLVEVAGVVQHDEHPPAGQQAAVQRRLRLQAHRDALRRHRECVQEPPDRLARVPSPSRWGRSPAGSRTAGRRGRRSRIWCAQCTARAVLPTPAVPASAVISTAPPVAAPWAAARACSRSSSASRPVKSAMPCGSWAGAGSSRPPPARCVGGELARLVALVAPALVGGQNLLVEPLQLGPGSMPSSSRRCRRAAWNAASASAWRPERYSASISSPRSRSRSGCSAMRCRSSATRSR